MHYAIFAIAGLAALILPGCGPTFNWRETALTGTSLTVLFPCNPQKTSRRLVLGGSEVELLMTGCDTGGVTLAVGHANISDPNRMAQALAQWREAALAGIHARSSAVSALRLELALETPQSVRVQALGARPDGRALALQAAWFARDGEVFGALLYGETLSPEVVDTFFSGLKFR